MHSEWLSESTENASQDVPNEADVVIIGGGSLGCQVSFDKGPFIKDVINQGGGGVCQKMILLNKLI